MLVVLHSMSVEQILKELPRLTPEERRALIEQLADLETQHTYRPTSEESAAIDEAIRSLEAGKGVPAAEIRQRFAAKWSR
jgi:transcription elongation GreA/GreB family factor